jgi:hypothetical protein
VEEVDRQEHGQRRSGGTLVAFEPPQRLPRAEQPPFAVGRIEPESVLSDWRSGTYGSEVGHIAQSHPLRPQW